LSLSVSISYGLEKVLSPSTLFRREGHFVGLLLPSYCSRRMRNIHVFSWALAGNVFCLNYVVLLRSCSLVAKTNGPFTAPISLSSCNRSSVKIFVFRIKTKVRCDLVVRSEPHISVILHSALERQSATCFVRTGRVHTLYLSGYY